MIFELYAYSTVLVASQPARLRIIWLQESVLQNSFVFTGSGVKECNSQNSVLREESSPSFRFQVQQGVVPICTNV